MNIHRIILAVLAAATIAVGTTTVTVCADGPDTGGSSDGGSPEIPEGLVPEEVLTGVALENWNALTPEFKAILLEDFILEIPERVPTPASESARSPYWWPRCSTCKNRGKGVKRRMQHALEGTGRRKALPGPASTIRTVELTAAGLLHS